jgi:folate/biopterin transporter
MIWPLLTVGFLTDFDFLGIQRLATLSKNSLFALLGFHAFHSNGVVKVTSILETNASNPITESPTHVGANPLAWIKMLNGVFGYKLLWMLFCSQHILKGFVMAYAGASADFLFRSYALQGPQLQVYKAIMALPWALKPIIGVISDTFPILGYKKAPYIMIVSVLAIAGFLYVGLSPDQAPLPAIVCGLIGGTLQTSVVDLLTEAKYSEKMREHTDFGPDLVTYVWSGVAMGGLVGTGTVGLILQYGGGPKTVYLICAGAAAIIFIPTSLGFMEEEKMTVREATAVTARMIRRQPEIIFLALLMACSVMALGVSGVMFQNIQLNFILALSIGFVVITSFGIVLRPLIASMTIFAFLQTCCALSIEGATFYFFTDTFEQYPEGPHFSPFFYTTVMGLVGGTCGLIGLWSYNNYMKQWTYRSIYWVANVAVTIIHLLGLILFTRTNLKWGISDKAFVLCGSVMNSLISTWMWIPGVVMLAHLCPKGLEASMYALLAGCHNLGSSVAQYSGAFMLSEMGIVPKGAPNESGQFEELWKAVLVSALLPLLSLTILPLCIPAKTQTETIITDHVHSATIGSIWERFRAMIGHKVSQHPEVDDLLDEPEVAGRELPTPPEFEPLIGKPSGQSSQ